jgi:HD-like signal output (HDOD) protein
VLDAGCHERALEPVFRTSGCRDYAVALTPGRLLRVDRQLFETLLKDETRSGIELEDLDLTETEGEIIARIYQACLNTLELPSMPEVALEIRKATEDPTWTSRTARIVQMDMAVTGGLIKAANSALYGGSAPVTNVACAIRASGHGHHPQLVMSIAMGQVFRPMPLKSDPHARTLGSQRTRLGAQLRDRPPLRPSGSRAGLLAGLLHDVGAVPILDYMGRHNPDIGPDEIEGIIERLHA